MGNLRNSMASILIIGHNNIGDVLHDMAVLKPLKTQFPKAPISFLTTPQGKAVLEGNPYLEHIYTYDKFSTGPSPLFSKWQLLWTLRKKKFDLIVNLKSGSYFAHFLGTKQIWQSSSKNKKLVIKRNNHAIDLHLNILRQQGFRINDEDLDLNLYPTPQDEKHVKALLAQEGLSFDHAYVVIAPYAAWHAKEWIPEHYGELAKKIVEEKKHRVIFIGGPQDVLKTKRFSTFQNYFVNFVGKMSLKELAVLYQHAQLVIGGDSGPVHLATNMKCKVLMIFGPTAHLLARPYWHTENVVRCEENLGCNPCIPGPHFLACQVYDRPTPCMEHIAFESVYQKTMQLLTH
ncbi:MAG: glycosyltransferase family 9 protein [Deltaproteobacteria bacterium]|nr:glycosyltransferase family 9 protein [Deltaproteobacteria bacterium]